MKLPALASAILLSLTFLNIAAYLSITRINFDQKVLGASTEMDSNQNLSNEIIFWEKIVNDNPTYVDGYLKLAVLEWPLDKTKSSHFLQIARELDPNSSKVHIIENKLK